MLWPTWLNTDVSGNPVLFVLRCLGNVLLVFAAGIVADMLRGLLFKGAGHLLAGKRLDRLLHTVDERLAGRES